MALVDEHGEPDLGFSECWCEVFYEFLEVEGEVSGVTSPLGDLHTEIDS
ncbi:hypothetical protein [Oerskovia sp. Root22]|nr:hypothetical protein [Oerskovia sp. Root22]